MQRRTFLAAPLFLAAAMPVVGQRSAPVVRIVGYNDMDEMLAALTARFGRHHPDVRFMLDLKSTRSAPAALLEGRAELAPMGADIEPETMAALTARWGTPPLLVPVAHASLDPRALSSPTGVFVSAAIPLERIDLAVLARFLGSDAPVPWSAIGIDRPGAPHLHGLGEETAIGKFVLRRLGLTRFGAQVARHGQSRDVAAAMAADPDALGFANLNHARPGIRALSLGDGAGGYVAPAADAIVAGRYPLDRHLLVYLPSGRKSPSAGIAAAFLRFVLSDDGQAIIAAGTKGYLPLNRYDRNAALKTIDRSTV